jgi:hypothetical protein
VPQSWNDWLAALVDDTTFFSTLIHDWLLGDDAEIHDQRADRIQRARNSLRLHRAGGRTRP